MHTLHGPRAWLALTATTLTLSASCGGVPGLPGGGAKFDPNSCGDYATTDVGRKLKAFLEATAALEKTAVETAELVKQSCVMMGQELGMAAGDLDSDTKTVCTRVINTIDENMKVAIKADAKLEVEYKPAVCTVDIDATAQAAAECEAKASGEVSVRCEGECTGTCAGRCDGECHAEGGSGGSSGECGGHCAGTCEGSCSGGCTGNADVQASAECKASAEVNASVNVECTEAEFNVEADAGIVVDASKAEMTIKALQVGIPKLLSVKERLKPLQASVKVWAKTASDLKSEALSITRNLTNGATCVAGQLAAAAGMAANINASISVSVEVSASASASAGAN